MPRSSRWRLVLLAFLFAAAAFFFHWLGAQQQLARSTFVNTVSLQAEEACLRSNDVECLRVSWKMREATTTLLASGLVDGTAPVPLGAELRAYLRWAEHLRAGAK
jgi:hypothetical protein